MIKGLHMSDKDAGSGSLQCLFNQFLVDNLEISPVKIKGFFIDHQLGGLGKALTDLPIHFLAGISADRNSQLALNHDNLGLAKVVFILIDNIRYICIAGKA